MFYKGNIICDDQHFNSFLSPWIPGSRRPRNPDPIPNNYLEHPLPELLTAVHGDNMLAQQLLHGKSLATLVAQELRDVQVLHHMVLQPGLGPVNKMEEKDHRQLSQMLHHMVPVLQPGLGPVKKIEEKDHRQLSQVLHHMVLQPGLGPVNKNGRERS